MSNNIVPIWTPQDAVDTAHQFHLELDNAERGTKLITRSRERRARYMDAIAVTLLMALMACLGVIVFASTAKADVSDDVLEYVARYGAGAVCPVLSDPEHHTVNRVLGVLLGVKQDGFSEFEAGQVVGMSVANYCPENMVLLRQFVLVYGDQGQVA